MVVRWDQFIGDFVDSEEVFESFWALVVAFLKDEGETAFFELGVNCCVGTDKVGLGEKIYEYHHDGVGVLYICNHDVLVS